MPSTLPCPVNTNLNLFLKHRSNDVKMLDLTSSCMLRTTTPLVIPLGMKFIEIKFTTCVILLQMPNRWCKIFKAFVCVHA